jgi:hypothetical protein
MMYLPAYLNIYILGRRIRGSVVDDGDGIRV